MIDEEDIIAAVQEASEEEDGEEGEEESIHNTISNIAALDSIQNIFNYLQQNLDSKSKRISNLRNESKMLL